MIIIRNIKQKVIRSIELKGNTEDNIVRYIENDKNVAKYKHRISDSEMLRAIETVDREHVFHDPYGKGDEELIYLEGIISVNVGYNLSKYKAITNADGILILQHWKWVNKNEEEKDSEGKDLEPQYKLEECGIEEHFKRIIVGSNHNRSKKALFVREDLFEKLDKIFLGGIDEYRETNQYPNYKKGYAKWNSYYGLVSTDSKVVSYIPKIIVIDDFERSVDDIFDTVVQTKDEDDDKDKYRKTYTVKENQKKSCKILPFDGAGLVSVECAKKWAKELGIKNSYGKFYIPAAFQIRLIPGIKGNLYTFDIEEFAKENGDIIIDINGLQHNLKEEKVDILLTKSQVKFLDLFDNDIQKWREIFDKPVIFYKKDEKGNDTSEIECSYRRTFNISEYSEDTCDLKKRMFSAYQHLLTVDIDDIESFTSATVDMIRKISCNIDEFLRFRNCTDTEEKGNKEEWKRIPPYYRAAYYAPKENRQIIFGDAYVKRKVKEDIRGIKNRALSGKLFITGNYELLTPDIYALAQYAFGKRGDDVAGLLQSEEIYSHWWLHQSAKKHTGFECDKLALIRNPHIYMEARIAEMVSSKNVEQYALIKKWFKYQTTGIVTDSYSTIPLALGTADFDGDHIATTNCKEYISAVEKARREGNGNTVDVEYIDLIHNNMEEKVSCDVSNIQELMKFDALAYQNNIGSVIDRVTNLWGIKRKKLDQYKEKIREYIKIMDIVGQLTIDAAKTGEFEPIPDEIDEFLKTNKILKPYFMKYLSKNEDRVKNEKNGLENADLFFAGQKEIKEKQEKFSNDEISLNKICWYLEKEFYKIECKIDEIALDTRNFLKIFIKENPCPTSTLYIGVKNKLIALVDEHSSMVKQFTGKNDSVNHYRYFYSYARNELLAVGKLSEEKSKNKILNCVIYACYQEKSLIDNDNAKNILWNCFEREMISRAKDIYADSVLDFSEIEKRMDKIEKWKERKQADTQKRGGLHISDLEKEDGKYAPIIIRKEDIEQIRETVSDEKLREHKIKKSHKIELQKLYSVLIIISKRLSGKRKVGRNKEEKYVSKGITIRNNSNNGLNYSNLSKLCEYSEYQRKNIKDRLKELNDLGAISVNTNNLSNLTFHVEYEKIDPESYDENDSLVYTNNYIIACEKILKKLL